VQAFDVLACGDEQLSGVSGGDSEQLGGARRRVGNERLKLRVELGDLGVEGVDPAGE